MSANSGCYDRVFSFLFGNQQVITQHSGDFKKDDELTTNTSKSALKVIHSLCNRQNELSPADYQSLAKSYVVIYQLDEEVLDEADRELQGAMRASKGFVKPFCDSIAATTDDKKIRPEMMRSICSRVSHIAATYYLSKPT